MGKTALEDKIQDLNAVHGATWEDVKRNLVWKIKLHPGEKHSYKQTRKGKEFFFVHSPLKNLYERPNSVEIKDNF